MKYKDTLLWIHWLLYLHVLEYVAGDDGVDDGEVVDGGGGDDVEVHFQSVRSHWSPVDLRSDEIPEEDADVADGGWQTGASPTSCRPLHGWKNTVGFHDGTKIYANLVNTSIMHQ